MLTGPVSMIPDIPSLNREDRETAPDDSPDSYRDIVRISIKDILPVPVCIIPLFAGVDDPVRMNRPFSGDLSTSFQTASHMDGTSCHSSIK